MFGEIARKPGGAGGPAWLALALPLALSLAAGGPPALAEMVTTDPSHIATPPRTPPLMAPRGGFAKKTQQPEKRDRVLVRREAPLDQSAKADQTLSAACRAGEFRQRQDQQQIAILDGQVYGAAVAGQPALYDPLGRGTLGIVYLFIGQGTTYCRVYALAGG
ncbi:MAG: hypothetical protein ACREDZ_09970 [Kiloniellales bacterium]